MPSPASPVTLGPLRLDNRLLAAPMAGVSDRTFRRLAREFGCALAFPEMVSDKALLWGNKKTVEFAAPYPGEKPFAVQLLGRDPDVLARAARLVVQRFAADLVDINMGCPVPKVAKNGEGAALLKDPALCGRIVERVARAVEGAPRAAGVASGTPASGPVPVSCKMRLGWDEPRAVQVARAVADAGAAFVTVHGRLRIQPYSVRADWAAIGEVAAAVAIPVVGNGDVLRPEDAGRMLAETGCRAVMIGRGAQGNPWIFARTLRLARTGDAGPPPTPAERVSLALRHLTLAAADKGERSAVLEMRRHGSWYVRGLPGAAAVRARLMRAETVAELTDVLADYLENLRRAAERQVPGPSQDEPGGAGQDAGGGGRSPEWPTSGG